MIRVCNPVDSKKAFSLTNVDIIAFFNLRYILFVDVSQTYPSKAWVAIIIIVET